MMQDLDWFRLASHLKMSLDEVKRTTTQRQLAAWMEYLKWEANNTTPDQYYIQQLTAHLCRVHSSNPAKMPSLSAFHMKFTSKPRVVQKKKSIYEQSMDLKKAFFAALRIPNDNSGGPSNSISAG